jgi:hypothetical protein
MSDASSARSEALIEIGKGIALGAMPFLGQAIDAYDTVQSAIVLYNRTQSQTATEEERDTAKFDFVLALVGWVPGPGDGVKKSLRLVNRDPDRYAPVLFDVLRWVLQECNIKTSPETLLDELFDAGYLKDQLAAMLQGVRESKAFAVLPQGTQDVVLSVLNQASGTLPDMVGVVQRRIKRWKRQQPNSSAHEAPRGRAQKEKPAKKDAEVAQRGDDRATDGQVNHVATAVAAEVPLPQLTNADAGVCGEHIADYICAQTFGWGPGWQAHDKGSAGTWTQGQPSAEVLGKLSKGGHPKLPGVLYKNSDSPNGTGIDAVWRATPGNNNGKPFAIVEAKATKNEDAPKFAKIPGHTRKPSIRSTLGNNAPEFNTPAVELLEPRDETPEGGKGASDAASTTGGKSSKPTGRQKAGKGLKPAPGSADQSATTPPDKSPRAKEPREILVQMSHEWIRANTRSAVGNQRIAAAILEKLPGDEKNYSRHLFFAPMWHNSGSPKAHMNARLSQLPQQSHTIHDAYHYQDSELKSAVNSRKRKLRSKFGENIQSLRAETA